MAAKQATFLLPFLDTNHPERGSETSKPTGNEKRTKPNSVSDKPSFCCIAGMRDAQLAKTNPNKKKKADTATRCALLDIVAVISIVETLHCQANIIAVGCPCLMLCKIDKRIKMEAGNDRGNKDNSEEEI